MTAKVGNPDLAETPCRMKLPPLIAIEVGISISDRSFVKVLTSEPVELTSQTVKRVNPESEEAGFVEAPATQIFPWVSRHPAVATSSPAVPRRRSQALPPCGVRAEINPSLPPSGGEITSREVVVSMVPNRRIFVGLVSSCEISSPPVKLVETVGESGSKGMAIGGAVVAAEAEEARKIEMARARRSVLFTPWPASDQQPPASPVLLALANPLGQLLANPRMSHLWGW